MWDERFNTEHYVYGEEPNSFLVEQWNKYELDENKGKVLCLAEGEGRNAVYLAERGHTVTTVDLSEVGLQKSARLAESRGVALETVQADLATYTPESNVYSAVVMIFAHTPTDIRKRSLQIAKDALRTGGYLILEGYTEYQIGRGTGGPGDKTMMFSKQELEQIFAPGEILLSRELVRDIHEGPLHNGEGAVVQFVAKKA
ncbi:cyclopropane-fatty-acyl-phospholipid synthase family protein [Marinobacter sp. 2_MG-2023]|uniref:SAM-dependent methyltransferase n=1 Tax=Marinobacter sp. 2_MG-2023 TaxID=3062679 RepID=UPI0026E35AB1|nr:class I SAM-dependent methyltransferase [Marinobacter sp. 2_MG-2023]MDO6443056.1 class I SAM-dependent methyltransferase [Marinobacter sp. 2_MG-2023]